MWSYNVVTRTSAPRALAAAVATMTATALTAPSNVVCCEEKPTSSTTPAVATKLRKQKTLQQAGFNNNTTNHRLPIRRVNTKEELSKLRVQEKEMTLRWERDEDGWRELPARAWPAYQPNPTQLQGIQQQVIQHGCATATAAKGDDDVFCTELLFQVATSLVFYNVDAETGWKQFEALAKQGHVDSMVACGIIFIEGFGIPPNEEEGLKWLEKAVALSSAQACYELAGVYYTGIDGVLEEDSQKAFELFSKAVELEEHTGAMFMMADCLLEGDGTSRDVARAVPLFYKAADRGHRYSRQRIRELLANEKYQT